MPSALTEALGPERWAAIDRLRPDASFTVSKWAWLRRTEPATAAAAGPSGCRTTTSPAA